MDRTSFKHLVTAIIIGAVLVSQVIWWAYHQLESVERQIELQRQVNWSLRHFIAEEIGDEFPHKPIDDPLLITERYPDVELQLGREQDTELLRLMGPSGAFFHLAPSSEFEQKLASFARRERRMFLSGAAFFIAAIIVGISILYGAYRRERDFARREELFISTISHELNTPLAAMGLTVDSMARRPEFAGAEKYMQRLRTSTRRLNQIVRTILDAQWVEEPAKALEVQELELLHVINEALGSVRDHAAGADAQVELVIPADLMVCSDARALQMVVCNLVRNAIQYGGEPPRVRVEAGRAARSWWLSVEDNGAGIPPNEREAVFARFYRRARDASAKSGTGLGLYLVRRIVGLLRGGIRIDESPVLGGARLMVRFKEVRKCRIAW